MIRFSISFIASFILLYLESLIVMQAFHYENGIYFANYHHLTVVLVLNFFLVFSILTHIKPWLTRVYRLELEEE